MTYCLPTPLNILLCNLPSFHKQYSNEKPFRASSILWCIFKKKTKCDFENFMIVIKCKNYLENVYYRVFCCIFCCLRLSPLDEVVQLTNIDACKALLLFFCFLFPGSEGKRSIPKSKLGKVFFI